jgi:putative acetyltransferase
VAADFTLRSYRVEDERAAIELLRLTWQQAYPSIDFAAREPWWRERWRNELVPNAARTPGHTARA